jgi:hypothetical protein
MYAHYKPLRNYLRGFHLWSALGTVYAYMQRIGWDHDLPPRLENIPLSLGLSPMRSQLHGHLVELMAREIVLNCQLRPGKPFNSAKPAFTTMSMIQKLEDRYWGAHDNRPTDILLQLSRLAFQQFSYQSPLATGEVARFHKLYAHPRVAPMVEALFGMSTDELFQIIMLLIQELAEGPAPPFAFLAEADPSIHEPVKALRDRIAKSAGDLRAELAARQSYGVNWAFSFNPMREYPLLHAGNPDSVMCPIPTMLVRRLTDGLFFDLIRSDDQFGDAVGDAFEAYVGSVAAHLGGDWLERHGEAIWGTPECKSVDWIMSDATGTLFVECKMARLDIASQSEITEQPPLAKALERLAKNIGQLYATLTDAMAGHYPHWQDDGRPIHPVVVTFYEWFYFGPYIHTTIAGLVDAEFVRRRLDPELLRRYPYHVCSISEFEGLLSACERAGIDPILSDKASPDYRQWLMHGYLADRHPGSISAARGAFKDGLRGLIHLRTRLTA